MAKLTAKQQKFVDEYLIDLNATQAAIRAGYKKTEYTDTNANKILEFEKLLINQWRNGQDGLVLIRIG